MVTIQDIELQTKDFPAPRGDFLGPYVDWDNDNNQHEVYVEQAGTQTDDSTTLHYTKKNAQGQVVDQGTFQPPTDQNGRPMKFVHIGAPLIIIPPGQSVGTFVVPYTAHGAGPNGGRRATRRYIKLPNVFAPHPRGAQANERFDVTLPDAPPPDPGGEPGGNMLTQEDITHIMDAFNTLIGASTHDARHGIYDKTKQAIVDAINEQKVLTVARFAAGGDPSVFQQQINTAYTGAKGAIHDSSGFGGGHSAQAPTEAPQQAGLPDTFTERTALGDAGIYEGGDQ